MVSDLKEDGSVTVPLICILTDYGVHRAWIAPYVDAMWLPARIWCQSWKALG